MKTVNQPFHRAFTEYCVSGCWCEPFTERECVTYVQQVSQSALYRAVQDGFLLPELPNFMQYYTWHHVYVVRGCHLHAHVVCMSSAPAHHPHTHVIRTSSAALLMVSMDLNYLSTLTGSGY